jgi:hypothetical protein
MSLADDDTHALDTDTHDDDDTSDVIIFCTSCDHILYFM